MKMYYIFTTSTIWRRHVMSVSEDSSASPRYYGCALQFAFRFIVVVDVDLININFHSKPNNTNSVSNTMSFHISTKDRLLALIDDIEIISK